MFHSTGFNCSGKYARLECDNNNIIVITNVISSQGTDENDCSVYDEQTKKHPDYEYEYDFIEKCNGGHSCNFKLPEKFGQNRINIIYSCVPGKYLMRSVADVTFSSSFFFFKKQ